MISCAKKSECSGCKACQNICPKNAIIFSKAEDGFTYPSLDESLCIKCGLCLKTCPVLDKAKGIAGEIETLAVQNNDEKILDESSSGGIFYSLAASVIADSGVVFGAAFDDDFTLKHIMVESTKELKKLMGSKYLQSDIGDTYRLIKQLLNDGKQVFFTGTPCQVLGLKMFLGQDYENLLTLDFICHGVPSQENFNNYLGYLENKFKLRIIDFSFRDKKNGWKNFSTRVSFESGKEVFIPHDEDFFMRAFLKDFTLRESCYDCKANNFRSKSDITVGDWWGIEKISSDFSDDKGCSAVVLKTKKGKKAFEKVSSNFKISKQLLDNLKKYNLPLTKSVKTPKLREEYLKNYAKTSFFISNIKYTCPTFKEKIKAVLNELK